MENETPEFFKERDILGMEKKSLPVKDTDLTEEDFESEEAKDENGDLYEDASKTIRFWGYIIDTIFYYAFAFLVGAVMGALNLGHLLDNMNDTLFGVFLLLIFYCLFEGAAGRTPGKFALGTKVITLNGETPGFGTVLGRTLCRFIPFEPFSFLGNGPGGWHDSITKTRVVKVK